MSKRHQTNKPEPLPKIERRAHAHAERHRIKCELHTLSNAVGRSIEIDDCDEPAVGWKSVHHHNIDHDSNPISRRSALRHWKLKDWKRRTAFRRSRNIEQVRQVKDA